MRTTRVATCLVVVLGAVLAAAPVAASPRASLRVLTFNIHHGAGADGLVDLPSALPAVRIDYVLTSPGVRVRAAQVHNAPTVVTASDHLPVSAVLTVGR
nr:hypothetical protein [Micromonospora sp. DSM 115978]